MRLKVMMETLQIDWWMVLVAFLLVAPMLHAQNRLTVSVTTPLPTLTAVGNSSDQQTMAVTTSWAQGGRNWWGNVTTCVYMTAPLTGTNGNPDTIQPANIMVTATGIGTTSIVSSGGCGVATALQVNSTFEIFFWAGSLTVPMQFQAVNTGNLAADTYSGTINIIVVTP